MRLALQDHFPVAGDGLRHLDRDRIGLGVHQLHGESGLIGMVVVAGARQLVELGLFAPDGDIEALPELQGDGLVFGSVINAILANELLA